MSLFRKRLSSPNQLATMRELEAQVDVGRVRLGSLGNAVQLSGVTVSAASSVVLNGAQLRVENVSVSIYATPGSYVTQHLCSCGVERSRGVLSLRSSPV